MGPTLTPADDETMVELNRDIDRLGMISARFSQIGSKPRLDDSDLSAVVTDSREVGQGSLFVALKGERRDGHDFVAEAFRRGARAALVERAVADPERGLGGVGITAEASEVLAERVAAMSDDRFQIRVHPAGEIVPGLQVMDAVQQGTVHVGQTASYYFTGKHPALAFDATSATAQAALARLLEETGRWPELASALEVELACAVEDSERFHAGRDFFERR